MWYTLLFIIRYSSICSDNFFICSLKALIEKKPVLKPALGENGEKGVMYYLTDATATFFKMMEPVETVKF